ncbi:MAG: SUMF1/EgtB/PvdO family nonheme iron enzyme [Saprospirales bacterium]|nr:SUMF1/EgtB/PvdO family nonheme iron enzyme [Saprospirales bacterium]
MVSWFGALAYANWLNEKNPGANYRLPTEAEWEYAARGGQKGLKNNFLYSGSDNLEEVGWYDLNSSNDTKPVGGKKPNELGLHDMSGNVWEWCADWWDGGYSFEAQTNPKGPNSGLYRVLRGGSWNVSFTGNCRVSLRDGDVPDDRGGNIGFRLAQD